MSSKVQKSARLSSLAVIITVATVVFPASGEQLGRPSNNEIIIDLRQNSLSAEEILNENMIASMRVVSLADFRGRQLQALEDTLNHTEDNFAEVRTAIGRNEAWQYELEQTGTALNDVRAVTRDEAGRVTVYIDLPTR